MYFHSLITLPNFFFLLNVCNILRRALSLDPLIALSNFTQKRMAKNEQLIRLRHYMYATYTKILIFVINFSFFCCFEFPCGFYLCKKKAKAVSKGTKTNDY